MATNGTNVEPRLELRGVTKRFPGVLANDNVSLVVKPGEIHALLGENGAGKSTLVKMIYGILTPDSGEILWDGAPTTITNPRAARRLGIGMVFQHFSLFEALTVLENIALGLDAKIPQKQLEAEIRRVLDLYGLKLDPHRIVTTLSVGERQRIEIVRALLLNPKLLIMDEPTSVLTPQEVGQLFETLRKLSAQGCSILYISHKLHEIIALCETATILRGGKFVAECDPRRETSKSMAELMIGANLKEIVRGPARSFGALKFEAIGLSLRKQGDFGMALKDISFGVRAGEILGVAGVAGNGQNELMEALSGEIAAANESILLEGKAIGAARSDGAAGARPLRRARGAQRPRRRRRFHPGAERRADREAADGIRLGRPAQHGPRARLRDQGDRRVLGEGARPPLDGGLAVGRQPAEVHHGPRNPAGADGDRGEPADLGRRRRRRRRRSGRRSSISAARGCAILVISQDLDELLELCDSLVVINLGALSRVMKVGEASIEEIGLLMGGVHGDPEATVEMTEALQHAH